MCRRLIMLKQHTPQHCRTPPKPASFVTAVYCSNDIDVKLICYGAGTANRCTLAPSNVGALYSTPPETEPPVRLIASANRPSRKHLSSTFSLWNFCGELCKGNTQSTTYRTYYWPSSPAIGHRVAPCSGRCHQSSHALLPPAAAVDTPCHRAVSPLCQLFSFVIVGPSWGSCCRCGDDALRQSSAPCPSESVTRECFDPQPRDAFLADQYKHMAIRKIPLSDDIARSLFVAPPVIQIPSLASPRSSLPKGKPPP